MKIEWNKVTWYSKLFALALFVALPFIGFYYGVQYEKAQIAIQNMPGLPGETDNRNQSSPGGRCGGNTTRPLSCPGGYHCAPEPGSHLPFGDVGGVCVPD